MLTFLFTPVTEYHFTQAALGGSFVKKNDEKELEKKNTAHYLIGNSGCRSLQRPGNAAMEWHTAIPVSCKYHHLLAGSRVAFVGTAVVWRLQGPQAQNDGWLPWRTPELATWWQLRAKSGNCRVIFVWGQNINNRIRKRIKNQIRTLL